MKLQPQHLPPEKEIELCKSLQKYKSTLAAGLDINVASLLQKVHIQREKTVKIDISEESGNFSSWHRIEVREDIRQNSAFTSISFKLQETRLPNLCKGI